MNNLNFSRLDLTDQPHFWCGFCSRVISLRNHGPAALDERFNHIDIEHFKKGERGQDWRFPSLAGLKLPPASGHNAVNWNEASPLVAEGNPRKRKFGVK